MNRKYQDIHIFSHLLDQSTNFPITCNINLSERIAHFLFQVLIHTDDIIHIPKLMSPNVRGAEIHHHEIPVLMFCEPAGQVGNLIAHFDKLIANCKKFLYAHRCWFLF